MVLLLGPLAFLLAFKFILDTSFLGALLLGIVAVFGYLCMAKFIGGGFSEKEDDSAYLHKTPPALICMARPASDVLNPSAGHVGV